MLESWQIQVSPLSVFLPLLDAALIPTFVVFGMSVHTAVIRSVDYRSETSIQMVLISVY